jgi:hypothetical protein
MIVADILDEALDKSGINSDAIRREIAEAFARLVADSRRGADVSDSLALLRLHHPPEALPLPKPGELVRYRDRHQHLELAGLNIMDFLRKVWGPWLEARAVTRMALRTIDPSAAKGVANWLLHKPVPPDIYLPTQHEVIDSTVEIMGSSERLLWRLTSSIKARRTKSPAPTAG